MKKFLVSIFILVLVLVMLFGCGDKKMTEEKSLEELIKIKNERDSDKTYIKGRMNEIVKTYDGIYHMGKKIKLNIIIKILFI